MPPSRPAVILRQYRRLQRQRGWMLGALALVILAATLVDFTLGPAGLSWADLGQAVFQPGSVPATTRVIVWDIRLPFALMALVVGLALGLAGAEMQTILNNPLASPFTLGIASAAAFGASLAIVLGLSLPGIPQSWAVSLNAFMFALLSALLLDAAARWWAIGATGLVLFGIALVFSLNAALSLVQFAASAQALQGLVFWTMGSLAQASWPAIGVLTVALLLALPLAHRAAWQLTALRLGEERAASFGIDVSRLRLGALLRISLLAGLAVSFVGTIGFVGLIAPHIARRLFGEDHRFYLPGSALVGAVVLSLASLVSKNLMDGVIVPVGIITSLIGVPFFLAVILRQPMK